MGHEFASLLDSSTILGVYIRRAGLPPTVRVVAHEKAGRVTRTRPARAARRRDRRPRAASERSAAFEADEQIGQLVLAIDRFVRKAVTTEPVLRSGRCGRHALVERGHG